MQPKMSLQVILSIFVFTLTLFSQNVATAQVWVDENSWSADWEARYSQWVKTNWNVDFFAKRTLQSGRANIYYGLTKDCADTVYSMRAIFAYENRLPFVMNDPTGGGRTISNKMSRFNRTQKQEQRIRQFLNFLDETVSTKSLPNDTYPTAVTRNTVRAGGVMMATPVNHHSWTIKEILPIGVPHLVYNSTVGAKSSYTLKQRQSFPNPYWMFEGDKTVAGHGGFRDWKPAAYLTKPVWQVPGYSDEQYKVSNDKWIKWAQKRLAVQNETNQNKLVRLTKTVCEGMQARIDAVQEGVDYLRSNQRCMNYETYDNYSTPSRDERIFDDLMALRSAFKDVTIADETNTLSPSLVRQMEKIFPFIEKRTADEAARMPGQNINEYSVCTIEYGKGRRMDMAEMKRRLFLGQISNNPHDDFEYRWGDARGSSSLARRCKAWDVWRPNLKQD